MRKINRGGLDLLKHFEGLRLDVYLCPAGYPTVGFGHRTTAPVGETITQHQADVILAHDLERFEAGVERLAPGANDNQFSALVCFAFNEGLGALERSTLLKRALAGDAAGASEEFGRWTKAGGRELPGLVSRREAERSLFLRAVA